MSLNQVILSGNLGQDVEVRYIPSGTAVATLSLATNRRYKRSDGELVSRTDWHRIEVWGKQAEACGQHLKKGRQITVTGRLQTDKWQDKDGQTRVLVKVVASSVEFGAVKQQQQEEQTEEANSFVSEDEKEAASQTLDHRDCTF